MRIKMTIAHNGTIRNFDQKVHESRDEFRGRAICAMSIPEGDEYFCWEQEGHRYSGPVGRHCLGTKHVHHHYAADERIPSLFVLVKGKVYDYREAPR